MSLVRRTAATEATVSTASESDMWITADSGSNKWTVAGYMAVVIMLCCMLVGLLAVWHTSRWVAETTSRGSQTLDGDHERCHMKVPVRFMNTRFGEAVNSSQDCQLILKSRSIQTMTWCSHCDPSGAQTKRDKVLPSYGR